MLETKEFFSDLGGKKNRNGGNNNINIDNEDDKEGEDYAVLRSSMSEAFKDHCPDTYLEKLIALVERERRQLQKMGQKITMD